MHKLGIIFFITFMLTACAMQIHPHLTTDLTREDWQQKIERTPNLWLKDADCWFLNGTPNPTEIANRNQKNGAINTIAFNIESVNKIHTNGVFQLQIFGTTEKNSLYVYGPRDALDCINVQVIRNTVYIQQTAPSLNMRHVIVRIGIRQLNKLVQNGCGKIEAINIKSNNLSIIATAAACGNIFVRGNYYLTKVVNAGFSKLVLLDANTTCVDIFSSGSGCINICGNVGARLIEHVGMGSINIIGLNSSLLTINAAGSGKIGLIGIANIKKIHAANNVCIFICGVRTDNLKVDLCNTAQIGLSGMAVDLSVEAYHDSRFYGAALCTQNVYARAFNTAHINVSAAARVFAAAKNFSSIYYFGSRNHLSAFADDTAVIIPIEDAYRSSCMIENPPLTAERNTMQAWRPLYKKIVV